jgi:hypothetical protein
MKKKLNLFFLLLFFLFILSNTLIDSLHFVGECWGESERGNGNGEWKRKKEKKK